MTSSSIAELLASRAAHLALALPVPLAVQLVAYFELLSRWNRKINLTSVADPVEAVDRLLLEPVAAAHELPTGLEMIDLGSGGGSPAIPLALASHVKHLVMVESRSRKAAFLREAVRTVGLPATVFCGRFEELQGDAEFRERFPVASVRAVRHDAALFTALRAVLAPFGTAALFGADVGDRFPTLGPRGLRWKRAVQLLPSPSSTLVLLERFT